MRNKTAPLDFIKFFQKDQLRIIDVVLPLHKKGLTITEIATETGLKRASIWNALKMYRRKKIAQSNFSVKEVRKRIGHFKQKPPYGFYRFEGQVLKDPKEYPIMKSIVGLWKQGSSINSIAQQLSNRGIKSRTGRAWSYNVIKSIIHRYLNKESQL